MKLLVVLALCVNLGMFKELPNGSMTLEDLYNIIQDHSLKISHMEDEIDSMKEATSVLQQENMELRQRLMMVGETAFTVFDGRTVSYNSGDAIQFTEEFLDVGNNYDGTSAYTCPVNGIYFFGTFSLVGGGNVAEGSIEVNGVITSGYHVNNDGTDGHMVAAMVVAQCSAGHRVVVRCRRNGSSIVGKYGEQWTSGFTGVLLHLT